MMCPSPLNNTSCLIRSTRSDITSERISYIHRYRWVLLKVDFLGAGKSVLLKHYPAYPIIIISLIIQSNLAKKIWAKWESGLTTVQLKRDPPVGHLTH